MAEILGAFEQAILITIFQLGDAAYGRAVFHELNDNVWKKGSAGAVYTTLERLENRGLLSSELREGTSIRAGRPRRYYSITPKGALALNSAREAMTMIWKATKWPIKATA
jgi:PadR family transcriptional regulator PadR